MNINLCTRKLGGMRWRPLVNCHYCLPYKLNVIKSDIYPRKPKGNVIRKLAMNMEMLAHAGPVVSKIGVRRGSDQEGVRVGEFSK